MTIHRLRIWLMLFLRKARFCSYVARLPAYRTTVDVEPEDMDLGGNIDNDLALDVDGDVDSQPNVDALDSDPEESDDESKLIDKDDTDSMFSPYT